MLSKFLIYIITMNIRFNLFFKAAAASMLAGTMLGARFGHVGQLD